MDTSILVSPRRASLFRVAAWTGGVVVVVAAVMATVGQSVQGLDALAFPGAVCLVICLATLRGALARTVLTPDGIRASTAFGTHFRRWSDVVDIAQETRHNRGGRYTMVIVHTQHRKLKLAVPTSSEKARDPAFGAKYSHIRWYWSEARRAGRPEADGAARTG